MVIIAFSYAYMIPKFPKAGGEFTFTKHCFGKERGLSLRMVSRSGLSDECTDELDCDRTDS